MRARPNSGFTLLELALVLVIVAVVTGMGINSTLGMLESAKSASTQKKLDAIEQALMAFRLSNNRLPCPGDITLAASSANFGVEAANPGSCTGGAPAVTYSATPAGGYTFGVAEGSVPVDALGLSDEYVFDGWGRRFAYAVDAHLTARDALLYTPTQDFCHVNVTNGAGGDRTGTSLNLGAAYTLVSYGPNGHGGRTGGAARINAGSTNASEQTNCHCSAAAADTAYSGSYVQKDYDLNPAAPTDAFDDVIRFKERWQMQSEDDQYRFSRQWSSLVVGETGIVRFTIPQCRNLFTAAANSSAGMGNPTSMAITPNNAHLLTYTTANNCRLYSMSFGLRPANNATTSLLYQITTADLGVNTVPGCPAYNVANIVAMSDNGYLAISSSGAPYVQVWKLAGNAFVPLSAAVVLNPPLGGQPSIMTFSKNADFLFVSRSAAVAYSSIYVRNGPDEFVLMQTQPASTYTSLSGAAFSPDGKYFAIADTAPLTDIVRLWRIDAANAFVSLPNLLAPPLGILSTVTFSPDSGFLAAGGGANSNPTNNLIVYRINPGDSFSSVTLAGGAFLSSFTPRQIVFLRDSSYLFVSSSASAHYFAFIRSGTTQFTREGTDGIAMGGGMAITTTR